MGIALSMAFIFDFALLPKTELNASMRPMVTWIVTGSAVILDFASCRWYEEVNRSRRIFTPPFRAHISVRNAK
jgi:hypothetical protein